MKFEELKLKGVFLIHAEGFEDERGIFRRNFCKKEFENYGITSNVAQTNISENNFMYTLRGFHYQISPSNESKVISCITGALYNVVIDLREESSTYHQWIALEISEITKESIYVPAGCANAFLTMSENTIVHYYMGDSFSPDTYHGIRYNDPMFSVDWPCEPKIISEKDLNISDYLSK